MFDIRHLFYAFGPIAYLLFLSGIIIMALSIERLITLYTQPKIPVKQLNDLTIIVKSGAINKAQEYNLSLPITLQNWISILLHYPTQVAEDELNLILEQKRITLQRPLEWLNLFAITSPMLGLLGTIWSMSHSFNLLSKSLGNDAMGKMINYLSEAMYATAFGIVLALLSMFFLYVLRLKSEQYLSKCELSLNRIKLALVHSTLNGNIL